MINFKYDKFNKYFKFYLIFVVFFASIQLFLKHEGGTDSTISEWLINYQGGFVRRGLLGEIFFQISVNLNIKIRLVIVIFQILIYSTYLFLLYVFIKKIKKNFVVIFAIFSPLLVVYHLAEIETLARKEVLLFIHFLILLIFIEQTKFKIIYLSITFPILILIWEPIIFFSGFYILILLVNLNVNSYFEFAKKILFPALPAIIIIFLILFNNYTNANQDLMCLNLQKYVGERCYMSLGYVTSSVKDNYMSLLNNIKFSHIARYVIALFIGFFPLILISFNLKKNEKIKNKFIKTTDFNKIYLLISLPVLNLFIMGLDWGRWSNIFYFYSLTAILYLIHKKYFHFDAKKIIIFLKNILGEKKINFILFLTFIIFSFSWNLKATFKEDIGSLPIYRIPIKTIKFFLNI